MYKCCWNCENGANAAAKTRDEEILFKSNKRFCCASYPVSNHAENPFKKRFCKQFEERAYFSFGSEISKFEAEKLLKMNEKERVKYWVGENDD